MTAISEGSVIYSYNAVGDGIGSVFFAARVFQELRHALVKEHTVLGRIYFIALIDFNALYTVIIVVAVKSIIADALDRSGYSDAFKLSAIDKCAIAYVFQPLRKRYLR